jgi:uncharacterized phage protein (TIGR02216 family)
MSERFAAAAVRLCGVAGIALGWRPEDFWRATPAELGTMLGLFIPGEGSAGVAPGEFDRLKRMFPDG